MEKYCPIISERIDARLIKTNASFVLTLLILSIVTPLNWLRYVVEVDFTIRVFFGVKNSPVCRIIISSLKVFNVKQHLVNAGPKKLAAKFGLAFSFLIIGLEFLGFHGSAVILTLIFILLTSLEVFYGFCLVCIIYPYINKIGIK